MLWIKTDPEFFYKPHDFQRPTLWAMFAIGRHSFLLFFHHRFPIPINTPVIKIKDPHQYMARGQSRIATDFAANAT